MKKLILTTVIAALTTASVFAQATVTINGSTVHVSGPDGTPVGFGAFAQLIGAPSSNAPESSLLPSITPPTTFRTGPLGGTLAAVSYSATFNNIAPDAPFASFELVAWDNSTGLYPTWTQASASWEGGVIDAGRSLEFTLANSGPPVTPNLSFRIGPYIPEPSAAVLMSLGAAALLIYSSRRQS
jgi:hypothetical protein